MLRTIEQFIDAQFLTMVFAAIAAGATVLTLAMPLLARDTLSMREGCCVRAREDQATRTRASGALQQDYAAAIAQGVHEHRCPELQSLEMGG